MNTPEVSITRSGRPSSISGSGTSMPTDSSTSVSNPGVTPISSLVGDAITGAESGIATVITWAKTYWLYIAIALVIWFWWKHRKKK